MLGVFARYLSKSKATWWAQQKAKFQEEFAVQLTTIQDAQAKVLHELQREHQVKTDDLDRLKRQLDEEEKELSTRRVRAAHASQELRTQLQLLEAKAAPDRVWVEAFSRGYEKAWDTVWPVMSQGVLKLEAIIEQRAIEATLARLDAMITQRAERLGQTQVREKVELLGKRQEFLTKQHAAQTAPDRERYAHYLTALDWMLNGTPVHSDQSVP